MNYVLYNHQINYDASGAANLLGESDGHSFIVPEEVRRISLMFGIEEWDQFLQSVVANESAIFYLHNEEWLDTEDMERLGWPFYEETKEMYTKPKGLFVTGIPDNTTVIGADLSLLTSRLCRHFELTVEQYHGRGSQHRANVRALQLRFSV